MRLRPLPVIFRILVITAGLAGVARLCGQEQAAREELAPYGEGTDKVHGVIRIHDSELTQNLVHLWQDEFLKLHPLVRYKEYTVPAWFNGLCAGTADLAFAGRRAYRSELKAFESIYGYPVTEFVFATGGFNQRKGNTPGVIIFVHKDNPLRGLTLDQLDGILGAERTRRVGRYAMDDRRSARAGERISGLGGSLASLASGRTIIRSAIFGIDATLSGWSGLIQQVVFKGGDKWNPVIHEIVRGGTEVPADAQIVKRRGTGPLRHWLQLHARGGARTPG
jgi:phosphate transport system substrate-binding protein